MMIFKICLLKQKSFKFTLKDPLFNKYTFMPFEYTLYFGKISIQALTYGDSRSKLCVIHGSRTKLIDVGIKSSNSSIDFYSHELGKLLNFLEDFSLILSF